MHERSDLAAILVRGRVSSGVDLLLVSGRLDPGSANRHPLVLGVEFEAALVIDGFNHWLSILLVEVVVLYQILIDALLCLSQLRLIILEVIFIGG
jgi:hypothetical protein